MSSKFNSNLSKLQRNRLKSKRLKPILMMALVSTVWSPVSYANVVGASFQNFNPTHSGKDFVTVYSSDTLGKGNFSLGLFINRATNTLPYFEGTDKDVNQSRGNTNDALVGADLSVGYGILNNWEIGLSVPQVLSQSVESDEGIHGEFVQTGLTDFRISSKVGLLKSGRSGLALIGSANLNQTQNNPFKGSEGSPTYNIEFAGDITLARLSLGANLGFRMINSGKGSDEVPIKPVSNQIIASAAAGYMIPSWKSKIIGEYYSSAPVKSKDELPGRDDASSEIIAGLKRYQNENLILHAGGGTELHNGVSTPDWRVYMGVNYVMNGNTKSTPSPKIVEETIEHREPDQVVVVNEILFKFDSAKMIRKESKKTMGNLAKLLNSGSPIQKIIIEGHTCNMGESEYNRRLSYQRANVIKETLVKEYGFKREQIKAVGFGETLPVASNTTAEGRKQNRRVEFKIFRDEVVATR